MQHPAMSVPVGGGRRHTCSSARPGQSAGCSPQLPKLWLTRKCYNIVQACLTCPLPHTERRCAAAVTRNVPVEMLPSTLHLGRAAHKTALELSSFPPFLRSQVRLRYIVWFFSLLHLVSSQTWLGAASAAGGLCPRVYTCDIFIKRSLHLQPAGALLPIRSAPMFWRRRHFWHLAANSWPSDALREAAMLLKRSPCPAPRLPSHGRLRHHRPPATSSPVCASFGVQQNRPRHRDSCSISAIPRHGESFALTIGAGESCPLRFCAQRASSPAIRRVCRWCGYSWVSLHTTYPYENSILQCRIVAS